MNKSKAIIRKNFDYITWSLGGFVVLASFIVWKKELHNLSLYSLFPLLGLLAFSLMWTHYVLHAMKEFSGLEKSVNQLYSKITSKTVLALLLLHPGLLIYKLFVDGYGLPPKSYSGYVAQSMVGFVLLGTISWLVFISFEFKSKLQKRSWWKYVLIANAVAMIMILIHSLKLGQNLQVGALRYIWYFYGASLISAYIFLMYKKKLY
jgi:hypothetical protein